LGDQDAVPVLAVVQEAVVTGERAGLVGLGVAPPSPAGRRLPLALAAGRQVGHAVTPMAVDRSNTISFGFSTQRRAMKCRATNPISPNLPWRPGNHTTSKSGSLTALSQSSPRSRRWESMGIGTTSTSGTIGSNRPSRSYHME